MKIKKLIIKNFLCYTDSTIAFSSPITQLVGESGSGKTTILEALLFLFFNRFPRYSKGILENTLISAEIDYKGSSYIIQSKLTKRTKEYLIQKNADIVLRTNQLKEYNQVLTDIFGELFSYNYSDVLDLVFLSSLTISKSFPLKLIDFLFNEKIITQYKDIFKKEENLFYDKIRRIEGQQREIQRQIKQLENIKRSSYNYDEVIQYITDINDKLTSLTKQQEMYYKQQITFIQEKSKIEQTISRYEKLLKNNVCPLCQRPFEPKEREKYRTIVIDNKKKQNDYESQLKQVEKIISRLEHEKTNLNTQLRKWNAELKLIETEQKQKQQEVNQLKNRYADLNNKKEKYKIYVDFIQNLQKYFNKVVLIKIREQIIKLLLEQMNNIANMLFDTPIDISIQEKVLFIQKDGKNLPYDLLSRGEKTRIYLSFVIVLHKLLNLPFGLLIDELLDSLDVNNYHKALKLLESVQMPFVIVTTTKLDSFEEKLVSQVFVEDLK